MSPIKGEVSKPALRHKGSFGWTNVSGWTLMKMSGRTAASYVIAGAGVLVAGLSHRWWVPLVGNTPPVRLFLVATVTISAWLGGIGPSTVATLLGVITIVVADDTDGNLLSLSNKLFRFCSLAALISLLFEGLHASHRRDEKREEALREAKEQAEAASQAKDQFLAVLSHELRTPMTPVLIAVQALLESNLDPALVPTLEMIRRNIELESRLIDDLLDLSRIVNGGIRLELEVVDIHQAIHSAMDICRDEATSSGLSVMTELNAPHHHVLADHARIMQIVWNLVKNAAMYTPKGGRLTIRTSNPDELSRRDDGDIASDEVSHPLVIEFEDTGIGLELVAIERIFDPFEQVQRNLRGRSSGLGLGLAICRSLTEAFGGRLTASSPGLGLGSTFRVELKTTTIARTAALAPLSSANSSACRHLHILLVEDNHDTLQFLSVVLRQRGHEVVAVDSLATARAEAEEADVPFDLLISDIQLPDGDGLELMRELSASRTMPGIAMSGFGAEEDLRLSHEAGFADHLTKPIDLNRLDAAIRHATVHVAPAVPAETGSR